MPYIPFLPPSPITIRGAGLTSYMPKWKRSDCPAESLQTMEPFPKPISAAFSFMTDAKAMQRVDKILPKEQSGNQLRRH